MKVLFFCPVWGSTNIKFTEFLLKAKKAGYDGIEMSLPLDKDKKKATISALEENDLPLIAQHWETVITDFDEHKKQYQNRLYNLADANPVFINSQTGKDFFTFEQNLELIDIAKKISNETGVKIIHETHRGKFGFAAHIARKFIEHLDDLKLGLDISHWCNVAETLLEDQVETVELALARAEHIHARIGFPEGPQIPDPRAPEWTDTVNHFINWWDQIIERVRNEKRDYFTITPEFGEYPYMIHQPFTQMPITDQWAVNVYIKDLLSERYR